jgi:hypothetical protein
MLKQDQSMMKQIETCLSYFRTKLIPSPRQHKEQGDGPHTCGSLNAHRKIHFSFKMSKALSHWLQNRSIHMNWPLREYQSTLVPLVI